MPLTHLNEAGAAHIVDVGAKAETARSATAAGTITMSRDAAAAIRAGAVAKGDVLAVARVAGIMAAKRTSELVPLCHPLALTRVDVALEVGEQTVSVSATVATLGRTGVEMEALTAATVALLTVYDMAKAIDKTMVIGDVRVLRKVGGKSGDWSVRGED